MRHGRAKAARKTLQFFGRTVGIKPPYHVLLDGTFMVAVVKFKFPLRERLDKVLQHASFTMYATKSCLDEIGKLKEATLHNKNDDNDKQQLLDDTLHWAKKECDVLEDSDIPEFETDTRAALDSNYPQLDEMQSPAGMDILKLSLLSSSSKQQQQKHHGSKFKLFFVACQDEKLLDILRYAGTVPCIRLARGSVLLLENPSKSGQLQATNEERRKWTASGTVQVEEKKLVDIVRDEQRKEKQQPLTQQQQQQHTTRRKRKAKEPNPLSCKKSKHTDAKDESSHKKRRRKKKS